ncbi:MAG: hypothetical protein KGJ86_18505 [Chloroflexota bacterium]|nr:hypothetical protein [Chloroflexota bacterium]
MGVRDTVRTLPANRLVFDLRIDAELRRRFEDPATFEGVLSEYGLSDDEKMLFRERDIARIGQMGLHPYMLPQLSRLFYGTAHNSNDSRAAQQYKKAIVDK